jgi:hypothetical protein
MRNRIVEIGESPAWLRIDRRQLVIECNGHPHPRGGAEANVPQCIRATLPCEPQHSSTITRCPSIVDECFKIAAKLCKLWNREAIDSALHSLYNFKDTHFLQLVQLMVSAWLIAAYGTEGCWFESSGVYLEPQRLTSSGSFHFQPDVPRYISDVRVLFSS